MKLSDLAKVAREAEHPIFRENYKTRTEAIALAVAKAVLAEAANTIEEERGGWRDWERDVSGTERAAGVCWSAERIRSLATELERESDAR